MVDFWVYQITYPLVMTNIAMENSPFIDGLPIKNGDFPWLCYITRGYMYWMCLKMDVSENRIQNSHGKNIIFSPFKKP